MKCIFPFGVLFAVAGCSGAAAPPTGGDDREVDASPAAVRADAAASDASDGAVGNEGDASSDASDVDAEEGDDALTCPTWVGDAGLTSLSDLAVPALCAAGNGRVVEWTTPCDGSIAVIQGEGVDCENVWLFDAMTHELQASASGCLHVACTAGAPGFAFPTSCFDGSFTPEVVELCSDASDQDAN
jgi:hypothetical protein